MIAPRRFLPSIAALQALEAVDRLGSATAAAEEMSLTQSAVSRQLKSLEEQLGVTLLNRASKRLTLTHAGAAYLADIRVALQKIAQASLNLQSNPSGGTVNLTILPTFGMRWLVPRLPRFAEAHPDITINLTTRLSPFSFGEQPFDAAITFGSGDWPETRKMWLKTEHVLPVAQPAFLERETLTTGHDLMRLPLLHIQHRPRSWQRWFATLGIDAGPLPGMVYDQFPTIVQAAVHGLGIALLPDFLIQQELKDGRLKIAIDGPPQSLGDYWLVWPDEDRNNRSLAAFREWLGDEVTQEDLLPR